MQDLKADLHIHTCLSPCARVRMSPAAIVRRAGALGIDVVGICDHNSAENAPAALEAGRRHGIHVLPGMEVCSAEEVHVLALFDDLPPVLRLQELVYRNLPGRNDEEGFGMQVIANADDEVLGTCDRLLIGATTLRIDEIVDATRSLGGLSVAAHVDRESFGLIGQLGFVPVDLSLDALEISAHLDRAEASRSLGESLPLIRSSDAHDVEEIGRASSVFRVEHACVEEIRKALGGLEGRRILR